MARRVTITVEASEAHHDILTIQDAFQQAIDFFDLLTDDAEKNVVWKLEMASTNSPFTCQGEPIDIRTQAGAHALVEERVGVIEQNLRRLAQGMDFDESFPRDKLEVARKLLRRNTNGVGLTKATLSGADETIEITQETAKSYFENLEPVESLYSYLFSRTSRREMGSIEGRIIEIGTDYDVPSIQVEDHNTGRRVSCRISPEKAEEIGAEMKASDAWNHRRVRVRGTLNYDSNGAVLRVIDGILTYIDVPSVDLDRLEDQDFTEGYSPSEYLDRLRENEFG